MGLHTLLTMSGEHKPVKDSFLSGLPRSGFRLPEDLPHLWQITRLLDATEAHQTIDNLVSCLAIWRRCRWQQRCWRYSRRIGNQRRWSSRQSCLDCGGRGHRGLGKQIGEAHLESRRRTSANDEQDQDDRPHNCRRGSADHLKSAFGDHLVHLMADDLG